MVKCNTASFFLAQLNPQKLDGCQTIGIRKMSAFAEQTCLKFCGIFHFSVVCQLRATLYSHFNCQYHSSPTMLLSEAADLLPGQQPPAVASTFTKKDTVAIRTQQLQFLRKQRKRPLHMAELMQEPGSGSCQSEDVDPVLQNYFCKSCQQVLPISAFYPSCLQRKVHSCKDCGKRKQVQSRGCQSGPSKSKPRWDEAMHMLERFRRRCAKLRTSPVEDTCASAMSAENGEEPGANMAEALDLISKTSMTGLRLGFDVKITRQLLQYWKYSSALHSLASSSKSTHSVVPEATNTPQPGSALKRQRCLAAPDEQSTASSTQLASAEPSAERRAETCTPDPVKADAEATPVSRVTAPTRRNAKTALTFILWNKSDTEYVQPWEVIPVTHAEAADFRNVPSYIRPRLIAPQLAAAVSTKLNELRLLCA
jgi:hypothetical protein